MLASGLVVVHWPHRVFTLGAKGRKLDDSPNFMLKAPSPGCLGGFILLHALRRACWGISFLHVIEGLLRAESYSMCPYTH